MVEMIKKFLLKRVVRFLERPLKEYHPISVPDPAAFRSVLRPCDIILMEGNLRYSQVIKYVTQSTWSHCGIFVGDAIDPATTGDEQRSVVEALISEGVVASPLKSFYGYNTRILRPVSLGDEERQKIIDFCVQKIGRQYDLLNVWELLCHFVPLFSIFYRKKIKNPRFFGENDPEKVICSSLIAQAFQSVHYPVLSDIGKRENIETKIEDEIHRKRHFSLYSPRDFDLSPFFTVVKPTIETGFDHKTINWYEDDDY